MKIHADDCPALCHRAICQEKHAFHFCTCTAEADLAELVAAAESYRTNETNPRAVRLHAALKPFREEKPK